MQDTRALNNTRSLTSWRAWQEEAWRRSGLIAILAAAFALTVGFVLACTLYGRARIDAAVVLAGFCLYAAAVLGLMAFAMLRLKAWKRANPWAPPS